MPVCKNCMAKALLGDDYSKIQVQPFADLLQKIDAPWFPEVLNSSIAQYNKGCQGKTVANESRKQIIATTCEILRFSSSIVTPKARQ